MRNTLFLAYSVETLLKHKKQIQTCLDKLTQEQIWWRGAESQNAAGNLVLHLAGNLTQWILETLGGEPSSRNRDAEFAARGGIANDELKRRLHDVVERSAAVIGGLSEQRLQDKVTVQTHHISVLEAIYHVVEHFSLHTGQILYATKLLEKMP